MNLEVENYTYKCQTNANTIYVSQDVFGETGLKTLTYHNPIDDQ